MGASRLLNAEDKELRIVELLPSLLCPLAIEPKIPVDFIALSPSGVLDCYDWIYWGPKETLEAYFKDPQSLKEPILRVKLSSNVIQTGPNTFSDNGDDSLKKLEEQFPEGFDHIEHQWGDYPISAVRFNVYPP